MIALCVGEDGERVCKCVCAFVCVSDGLISCACICACVGARAGEEEPSLLLLARQKLLSFKDEYRLEVIALQVLAITHA